MTVDSKGRELFIVDNSVSGWTGLRYLEEWSSIAKAFDIATGYFEIGALLTLDGKWQELDKIRILMGAETTHRTRKAILEAVRAQALDRLDERVGWSDGTVWLDASKTSAREGHRATKPGTTGFQGVPEEVWDFQIGGYQVCHKWLKDRKGRTLSDEDIAHYQKIVVALSETIRIMAEIDEVIEAHGGWPDAFQTESEANAASEGTAKVLPFRPRTIEPAPEDRYVTCVPLVPLRAAAGYGSWGVASTHRAPCTRCQHGVKSASGGASSSVFCCGSACRGSRISRVPSAGDIGKRLSLPIAPPRAIGTSGCTACIAGSRPSETTGFRSRTGWKDSSWPSCAGRGAVLRRGSVGSNSASKRRGRRLARESPISSSAAAALPVR